MVTTRLMRCGFAVSLLAGGCLLFPAAVKAQSSRQIAGRNTPAFVASAKNLGPANPNQTIEVSLWLNLHNKAQLDTLTADLYNPSSPQYHQWLSSAELTSTYAPTAAEVKTVQSFLTSHGLALVNVGPSNLFVRASGTVAAVSKAFQVSLTNFQVGSNVVRANTTDPIITGPAAALVRGVQGLDNAQMQTHNVSRNSFRQPLGTPNGLQSAAAKPLPSGFFPNVCFDGVKTRVLNFGTYPIAEYKGNHYFGDDTTASCGYTPQEIYTAYKLNSLYSKGLDGTGQTIVIEDWCGSATIVQEANYFSSFFGLPPLTNANFSQIFYPTQSTCVGGNPVEIDIDVEWAHAIAPGANIILLVPPSPEFQDTDAAQVYAELYHLGNVLSGSYGAEELYVSPSELIIEEDIAEIGAVLGVATNFSTGDFGDFTFDEGYPPSVSIPAAVPYNTAVGGISLSMNSSSSILWQAGWGTNINELSFDSVVYYPPSGFFNFGSGGGSSYFYPKPWYQSKLPGTTRQVPDISWLADPYTGAVIVTSNAFQFPPETFEVYGGTSLACPMFSALWAIANQEAGSDLGQAAPYVYNMPAGAITDIVPVSSPTNVTGWVIPSPGAQKVYYSAADLAQPLEGNTKFVSAIWDYPDYPNSEILITFGTDSGLVVTKGYDHVTGVGVPNPSPFVEFFKP